MPPWKGPKAHWRKWHFPLICTHLKCKHWKTFLRKKSGSKSARMANLWQILRSHSKPAFSEKVQREDQGNFFKNRQKRSPRLQGLKAIWRKWHYLPISMHLKCKDWKRFWCKKRLQTVPEWPYNNFRKVTQNPHFLKNCKGGTKGNFSKIPQKVAFALVAHKHSRTNGIIL